MLRVTTPKDLTTVLVKMDLKATAKTARVRFCLGALRQKAYRIEILVVNLFFAFFLLFVAVFLLCFVIIVFVSLFSFRVDLFGNLTDNYNIS